MILLLLYEFFEHEVINKKVWMPSDILTFVVNGETKE